MSFWRGLGADSRERYWPSATELMGKSKIGLQFQSPGALAMQPPSALTQSRLLATHAVMAAAGLSPWRRQVTLRMSTSHSHVVTRTPIISAWEACVAGLGDSEETPEAVGGESERRSEDLTIPICAISSWKLARQLSYFLRLGSSVTCRGSARAFSGTVKQQQL